MALSTAPAVATNDDDVSGALQRADRAGNGAQAETRIIRVFDGRTGAPVLNQTSNRDG